jgi:hypothetical protein
MKATKAARRMLSGGCTALLLAFTTASVARADPGGTNAGTGASTTSQYRPKGRPPSAGSDATAKSSPRVITTPADGAFFYGIVGQDFAVADGARGYYTIEKPYVASTDFHSLAELAVSSSSDELAQVIEVGWTVDPGLNGDNDPHLFVYHWVDGARTCYNACGFVPVPNEQGYAAGMKLPVTSTPLQFSILHHGTAWLVGFNGHTFGYFPDSLWSAKFTLTGLVQWFGEVAAAVGETTPCTEMGNGKFAVSPTAAQIRNIGYFPARVDLKARDVATKPDLYTILKVLPAGYRFGGPGASCRSAPDVIGDTPTVATHVITASNLVVGTTGTITDPLCEDLNKVVSQTPAPGTHVSVGSTVNFIYAVPPANGCPVPPK